MSKLILCFDPAATKCQQDLMAIEPDMLGISIHMFAKQL
jgi:hypothetical protein